MKMANQKEIIQNNRTENNQLDTTNSVDLTRLLFESQTKGLAELYESLNKSISINKIIESSKSFQKTNSKSLRQIYLMAQR
jgi:hypothetical protein